MSQRLFVTEPSLQMPIEASDSHKAALLLHALGESDRAWMLGELPPPQQRQLQLLLNELETLGIPVDREFVQKVIATSAAGATQSKSVTDALENADPLALARVLSAEPAELIAGLIALRTWPWKERLLSELKDGKRNAVLARLAQTEVSAKPPLVRQIDRQLMDLLVERLASMPPAEPASERWPFASRRPWWRRLLRSEQPVEKNR